MLEESTDNDVTIFSSEEDEMVMNPTVTKMDNWMTILKQMKMEALVLATPKTPHLKWTNTLNFKELEKCENLSGPKHSLPVGSNEKDFLSYL